MTIKISLEPALEALLCQKAAEQGRDLNQLVTDLITDALQSESVGIVRTERGLTIEGTRITIYDVMDYLTGGYDSEHIRKMLSLTQAQWSAARAYIDTHHVEVVGEYHQVLEQAEESRQYWETRNREILAHINAEKPEYEITAAHKKLQAWKIRLNAQQA